MVRKTIKFIMLGMYPRPASHYLEGEAAMQHHHRFEHLQNVAPISTAAAAAPAAGAFMLCPVALMQGWMGQPWLLLATYQQAYECAQAVVRPSRLERLQVATLN